MAPRYGHATMFEVSKDMQVVSRDQEYHLPAIYNQSILPKPEPTHMTPVRDQDL